VVIGLESTNARLHRLAGTALYEEEFVTMEEVIRRVEAVTLDEVAALAHEFYEPEKQTIVRLGPA
jgi:predicted Zn-dependent peptidase